MRTIKLWHRTYSDGATPQEGGVMVAMAGYNRFEDFYLCVPRVGVFFRAANQSRYSPFMSELFIDGEFVGACRIDKRNYIKRLYLAGEIKEAKQYALGHRLWRETKLGGANIIPAKERARISHELCDQSGNEGHCIRQMIRQKLKYNL